MATLDNVADFWEKSPFRQYVIRSSDNKLFWCSPDALVNGSPILKKMLEENLEKKDISLNIPSIYLDYIFHYFHNPPYIKQTIGFIAITDWIFLLSHIVSLEAHTLKRKVEDKIRKSFGHYLLTIDDLIALPDNLYRSNNKLVREIYKDCLKVYFPRRIQERFCLQSRFEKSEVPLILPHDTPTRVMRYIIEESINVYDYPPN